MHGMIGVGKSTFAGVLHDACLQRNVMFGQFNAGDRRRSDTQIIHPEDFRKYPDRLNDISRSTLVACLNSFGTYDDNYIAVFDQTSTREKSREQIWELIRNRIDFNAVMVEIFTQNLENLYAGFKDKIKAPDLMKMEPHNAYQEIWERFEIYRENYSHYMNDAYFKNNPIPYIVFNRDQGDIFWGRYQSENSPIFNMISDTFYKVCDAYQIAHKTPRMHSFNYLNTTLDPIIQSNPLIHCSSAS